jgi:hypothetical protein
MSNGQNACTCNLSERELLFTIEKIINERKGLSG